MITRPAFHFIYVNANSLVELALRNLSSDLDSLLDDIEPNENTDLALELETNLEDLDFSAMDGLEFYDAKIEANIPEPVLTSPAKDVTNNLLTEIPQQISDFNINTYMTNVYSLEEQLIERIDAAYHQIEHAKFEILLNLLPLELPSIDKKMSGEDMTLWLEQYANDVVSISNLLVAIRQLDFT